MTPEQDIECLRYLAKFKGDDDVLGDVPYTLLESVADRLERLTAENERLAAGKDAAIRTLADSRFPPVTRINDAIAILSRSGIVQQNAPRCSRCGENHSPRCE